MKRRFPLIALATTALTLLGCHREPKAVPVTSLSFPVVLVTGTRPSHELPHRARVLANAGQLGHMRVELYSALTDTTAHDPPIVIDSRAAVFEMKEIQGEHGGMWMMANPTGMMPVRFKLMPRGDGGIVAARAIVAACDHFEYVMDSEQRDQRRERIRRAGSMAEIATIVGEQPPATSVP